LRLSLHERHDGVSTVAGNRVSYDVAHDEAHFGAVTFAGHGLVWELAEGGDADGELLGCDIELDPGTDWVVRCDRVDFPPGGVAYLHTHPGPGLRYLLRGAIEIETGGHSSRYGPGGAWFENGSDPVHARASRDEETSFVRVMLLPAEWEGKRTIRYVDPADVDRPKLQRATVFFDHAVTLP
jgi:quercetin dioxygenase-like cupin family protein